MLPVIPIATDLPSLIRAVNIMRDILRSLTTSLTVNNVWLPRAPQPPRLAPERNYIMSAYPDWQQSGMDIEQGMVFYKGKDGPDDTQGKVAVSRTHEVEFRNTNLDDDKSFYWKYHKNLDDGGGSGDIFREDFFERIVNVHWTEGLAVYIYPGGQGPGELPLEKDHN